jgi:dihydroneopterin aldolase
MSELPAAPPDQPERRAGGEKLRRLFIRDLTLLAQIGVWRHEHGRRQRVRISIEMEVRETPIADDRLDGVVNYASIVEAVREEVAAGHVRLIETLAERIAARCFADARVRRARIQVEKLDVFPDAASVGVEIERDSPLE